MGEWIVTLFITIVTKSHEPPSRVQGLGIFLPLVSRAWKTGSNSSYNCTPFLHSLLTKGKFGNRGVFTKLLTWSWEYFVGGSIKKAYDVVQVVILLGLLLKEFIKPGSRV